MSRFEIKMPKLGESITEGTIVSWSVKVGDIIQEDDVLFEVNTAKVSAEIPSPVAGKVVEILFKEGDTVAVGTVVAVVDMGGEEDDSSQENVSDSHEKVFAESEIQKGNQESIETKEERWYSPVVIQLAREAKIPKEELDSIQGTGYEGRLSKRTFRNAGACTVCALCIVSKNGITGRQCTCCICKCCTCNNSTRCCCIIRGVQHSGSGGERNGPGSPYHCRSYGYVKESISARNQCCGGRCY